MIKLEQGGRISFGQWAICINSSTSEQFAEMMNKTIDVNIKN